MRKKTIIWSKINVDHGIQKEPIAFHNSLSNVVSIKLNQLKRQGIDLLLRWNSKLGLQDGWRR